MDNFTSNGTRAANSGAQHPHTGANSARPNDGANGNARDRAKARRLDSPASHAAQPPGELSAKHKEKLRGILPAIITDRPYTAIGDNLTLETLGFQPSAPGLLFAWRNVDGEIGGYQFRPDVALPDKNKPGKKIKYLFPKGRKNFADVPPVCLASIGDPKKPLWIVEGPIKADYLASQGACAIGLAGVSGWHCTNVEKGKTAIPCFRSIALNGRRVYICFDSDLQHNPAIRKQAMELRTFLESKGALVSFIVIPDDDNGDKQGPDDFINNGGTLEQLQSFAVSSAPPTDGDKPKSQADALLEIALNEAKVFCTDRDEVFAAVEQNGQTLNLRVRSMAFRSWLNLRHFEITGRAAGSKGAADAAISVLDAVARRNPTREVFARVVATESAVYYDLADAKGRAVEIRADGWKIVERPPVAFYRPKGTRPQVEPQRGGDFEMLREIVNVKTGDLPLVAAWLTAFFQPFGPRPHLGIVAEQGSGKSKATAFLRCLIDPNATPTRVASPKDARDLFIAAKANAILAFDNLSYIPGWFSDALCCLATGAGYATRALYTDDDEEVFAVQRPVIFNAITDVATRPDLLDRTILLELPRVPESARKDEREIDAVFDRCAPLILGALFDAVAEGLKNLPTTRPDNLPRMADFARWVAACAPAMGEGGQQFEGAYRRNRETVGDLVAETSTVLQAFEDWAATKQEDSDGVIFNDAATHLLTALNKSVDFDTQKATDWPKSAGGLGRALKRLAPILRARGLDIGTGKRDGNRALKVTRTQPEPEKETARPEEKRPENGPKNGPNDKETARNERNGPKTARPSEASYSQKTPKSDESGRLAVLSRNFPFLGEKEEKEREGREEGEKKGISRDKTAKRLNGPDTDLEAAEEEEGDVL